MKKIFFILGLSATVMLGSCSGGNKTENTSESAETEVTDTLPTETVTDKAEPQGFAQKMQAQDSTIQITPSGLGYKIVKETRGIRPDKTSTVKVKYTGKHVNGEVFDNGGGNAIEFPLDGVIRGFAEGISLMPVGSTYILYIPSDLGYGSQGTPGGPIAPNEDLIFEVELVEIL